MGRMVAFLRAINVGGRRVTMETLRALFQNMGLENVQTVLAAGNVIFEAPDDEEEEALARRMEGALAAGLGYEVAVMLRSGAEVTAVVQGSPFAAVERGPEATVYVMFLREEVTAVAAQRLEAGSNEIDELRVLGREVHWLYRRGRGESTVGNGALERALGVAGTARNLNTVERLVGKLSSPSGRRPASD